jgi:hypothetical protein
MLSSDLHRPRIDGVTRKGKVRCVQGVDEGRLQNGVLKPLRDADLIL